MTRILSLSAFLPLLLLSTPASAIVGGAPPDPDDRRFDAIGAFSTAQWLGLASPAAPNPADDNWFCNATLVAPDVVITAAHCIQLPWTEGEYLPHTIDHQFVVRFRRALDGSLGSKEAGPESYHQVRIARLVASGHDFAVGYLEEPVTHIDPLPMSYIVDRRLVPGTPIWLAGWGKEGPERGLGPKNQLLIAQTEIVPVSSAPLDRIGVPDAWDPTGPGVGVNLHDSGSPLLMMNEISGALHVVGVVVIYTGGHGLDRYAGDFPDVVHSPFSHPDLSPDPTAFDDLRTLVSPGGAFTIDVRNFGSASLPPRDRVGVYLEAIGETATHTVGEAVFDGLEAHGSTSVTIPLAPDAPIGTYRARVSLSVDDALDADDRRETGHRGLMVSPEGVPYRTYFRGHVELPGSPFAGLVSIAARPDGTATLLGMLTAGRQILAAEGTVAEDGTLRFDAIDATLTPDAEGGIGGSYGAGGTIVADALDPFDRVGHLSGTYRSVHGGELQAIALVDPDGKGFAVVTDADGGRSLSYIGVATDGSVTTSVSIGAAIEGDAGWWADGRAYRIVATTDHDGAAATLELLRGHGERSPPVLDAAEGRFEVPERPIDGSFADEPADRGAPPVDADAADLVPMANGCSAAPRASSPAWLCLFLGLLALGRPARRRRRGLPRTTAGLRSER